MNAEQLEACRALAEIVAEWAEADAAWAAVSTTDPTFDTKLERVRAAESALRKAAGR